ncbi:hypothetical protein VNO78_22742 [Psophocarpus tetragonolobus]|uniref:Uncharacterized protein n=1 Tax=Psophocarpus tetragonolobus TaxID=3891 RepID=A0AAN9XC43_PSOTE
MSNSRHAELEPSPDGAVPALAALPFFICSVSPRPSLKGFNQRDFCSATTDFNSFSMTFFMLVLLPLPCSSRSPTTFIVFLHFTNGLASHTPILLNLTPIGLG